MFTIFFLSNLLQSVFSLQQDSPEETPVPKEDDKLMEEDKKSSRKNSATAAASDVEVKFSATNDNADIQENGSSAAVPKRESTERGSFESAAHNVKRILAPIMFEGESDHSLLRPKFKNPRMETQYKSSYFSAELFRLVFS